LAGSNSKRIANLTLFDAYVNDIYVNDIYYRRVRSFPGWIPKTLSNIQIFEAQDAADMGVVLCTRRHDTYLGGWEFEVGCA
jgi:hypothetical protein